MQVRYGRGEIPPGFLQIFSVNSEDEAKRLIVATCSLGLDGHYYAAEMAANQTLDQFALFGQKLERTYAHILAHDASACSLARARKRPRRPRSPGKAVPPARKRRAD